MRYLTVTPGFWTQTCVASLMMNPPMANGCEVVIVLVDNSPWSPAVRGITDTSILKAKSPSIRFDVIQNHKSNQFHASALDCVVERYKFEYLMALETDVLMLRPTWLQWFGNQMEVTDFAVGHWHHEQFINPSCTLYRGDVLRKMAWWCQPGNSNNAPQDKLRWGHDFSLSQPVAARQPERDYQGWYDDNVSWIAGPFAEKRGWPAGTVLKVEPSGQMKGPGWYEPGQQLHHWAVEAGYTYTVCPTLTTQVNNVPVQTLYGASISDPHCQLEPGDLFDSAEAVHLWGGTRALDIIKHPVTCEFVKANMPGWLAREARFWRQVVPPDVQGETLELIRRYGFHYKGQGTDHVTERDKEAAGYVRSCYKNGGVEW